MIQITKQGSVFLVKISGPASLADFLAATRELYDEPDYPHCNVIWDLKDVELSLDFRHIAKINEFIAANYPAGATRTKTAMVVNPGFDTSLAKMWVVTTKALPYETKVFSQMEDAVSWVAA